MCHGVGRGREDAPWKFLARIIYNERTTPIAAIWDRTTVKSDVLKKLTP